MRRGLEPLKGNPGLQRESGPATHSRLPGRGSGCGTQELGWGLGAKGEGRQKAYNTRYSQVVSHPWTKAGPTLLSLQDRKKSGVFRLLWP